MSITNPDNFGFESIDAARPGPKSSAQTPAKPSERKKGSSKNKPGSAGSKSDKAIEFSKKIIEALKNKVKEHNSKNKKKVTLGQLKKVFRRVSFCVFSATKVSLAFLSSSLINSVMDEALTSLRRSSVI